MTTPISSVEPGTSVHSGGKWLCSIAPVLYIYLEEPPTGAEALAALDLYRTVCPPDRLKFLSGTRAGGWPPVGTQAAQDLLARHVAAMNKRKDQGVIVWDGEMENTWTFSIRGVPLDDDVPKPAFCQANFPNGTDPKLIVKLALGLADLLPFRSGHAGYTAVFSAERKFTAFNQIYAWAKHYPGMEVDDLNVSLPHLNDAIKGANWLTLVGKRLLGRLPGTSLRFSPDVRVLQAQHGVVIQAGDAPVLGRRNAGETPALYVEVEQALASIKVTQHGEFVGRFEEEQATLQWLYRFLRPDEW